MSKKINNFPTLTERETVATLRKFDKLYRNEQFAVLGVHELIKKQYKNLSDLVYISHAIPARISDFYGDFVAGDPDRMVIQVSSDENDGDSKQGDLETIIFNNDLPEKINDFATDQSEFGFTVLYAYKDERGDIIIESVPQDQYFPQRNGDVVIATYKKDLTDQINPKTYMLAQTFSMDIATGNVKVSREVFVCDDKGVAKEGSTLEKWAELTGRVLEVEVDLGALNMLPLVQVDNGRKTTTGFGKSDFNDIIPQLAEINERRTQIATQFLKNLDAKMQLPASMADEDGKVEPFDTVLIDTKDDPEAKYITNENAMIAEAEEHILSQIRIISEVTGVPMWSLTKGTMPERVESLRIQLFSAIRKTHRKRAKLKRGIQDIIRVAFALLGTPLEKDPMIKFSDVIPTDDLVQAETESAKVIAGLSSKRSSIMRLENLTEEEAQAELDQIAEENALAGFGGNTPTL